MMTSEKVADLRVSFEKDNSAELKARAEDLYKLLMWGGELRDETVYTELFTYLMVQALRYALLQSQSKDLYEWRAYRDLSRAYEAIFRIPGAAEHLAYIYCGEQEEDCWNKREKDESLRWLYLSEAFRRAVEDVDKVNWE